MITLLLSNVINLSFGQSVVAWVTVAVDVVTALVLLIKAIKAKSISIQDIINYLQTTKGKADLSKEIENAIKALEDKQNKDENDEN